MWELCMQTPLGSTVSVTGEEITLEKMDKKQVLQEALSPKTDAAKARENDNGDIPGDHLGKNLLFFSCGVQIQGYSL